MIQCSIPHRCALQDPSLITIGSSTSQTFTGWWRGHLIQTWVLLSEKKIALPQDKIQHFHQHLNSIETTIQFTVEMLLCATGETPHVTCLLWRSTPVESTLPFLDTRITHHCDGSLSTTVFRKSTHMDKYLDFQSHHPLAHKVAVARTLFDHAKKICSDFPDSEKEKEHFAKALQSNGCPRRLVMKNWQPPPCSQWREQDPPQLPYHTSVI